MDTENEVSSDESSSILEPRTNNHATHDYDSDETVDYNYEPQPGPSRINQDTVTDQSSTSSFDQQ